MTEAQFSCIVALSTVGVLLLLTFVIRLAVLNRIPPPRGVSFVSTHASIHLGGKP